MNIKIARLTAGGVSKTIASDSQVTPLRKRTLESIYRIAAIQNDHHTCLQRMGVRPNMPPPLRRRRNRPTSMIRIKDRSAKIVGIMPNKAFSVTERHLSIIGFHVERSYACVKPRLLKRFKNWSLTRTIPITTTLTWNYCGCPQEDYWEELTVDVKPNAGPPYND